MARPAYSFTPRNFLERPRHISLAIDYLLSTWPGHDNIDPARIGAFGHSAGGFTVLVAIGGTPEFARMITFCHEHPDHWGCQRGREEARSRDPGSGPPTAVRVHDARIKAAVIAAPAAGLRLCRCRPDHGDRAGAAVGARRRSRCAQSVERGHRQS